MRERNFQVVVGFSAQRTTDVSGASERSGSVEGQRVGRFLKVLVDSARNCQSFGAGHEEGIEPKVKHGFL